jgi:RNA polymerase sigma factor (TIGR02999 family)
MSDVTRILSAIEQGDPSAAEQLLPLVYDELRKLAAQKLAQEKPGQTLQATALVHEAYLRLIGAETSQSWNSRGHFFAAAAEAMRRILIERARRKGRMKPTARGLRWLSAGGFTSSDVMQILSTIEAEQRSTNR